MPHTVASIVLLPVSEVSSHTGPQIPITSRDHLFLTHKGFNYYLIDLKVTDWDRIGNIICACEEVEQECWAAQEKFSEYLKKRDVLSYVEKDGKIIAFDVVTLLRLGDACIYSNDETMVLKAFRGRNLARNLVFATCQWFFTRTSRFAGVRHIVYLSISANPRVINGYFKNAYTRILFDCSFKPTRDLILIKEAYCRFFNLSALHPDFPFCLKRVFPGSNSIDLHDPGSRFSSRVRLPADFDHIKRGDAFAFMVKVPKPAARMVVLIVMAVSFGRRFLATPRHVKTQYDPGQSTVPVWQSIQ
ncbi:MAG: hypothetical protein ABFD81_07415 [Syntrophaceae bacterium]